LGQAPTIDRYITNIARQTVAENIPLSAVTIYDSATLIGKIVSKEAFGAHYSFMFSAINVV